MDNRMDQTLFVEEKRLRANYEDILAKEEVFQRQKSKELWLSDGDRNSKFFHNSTKQRSSVNRITKIRLSGGHYTEDPNLIIVHAFKYFENILNNQEGSNVSSRDTILANIPKIITDVQSKSLGASFTKEEVEVALRQMNLDKAPGSDDFPTAFFQKCWHFIGDDVMRALEGAKNSGKVLKEINNTFITLIPKKKKVDNFDNLRPIYLCNTIYKLLSKTIANRLQKLLPLLISEDQMGFVPGRSIFYGIIIAQEAILSIQQNKESSMLIKLYIKKAYDKVDQHFLCKCMEAFGFSKSWINLIYECISSP